MNLLSLPSDILMHILDFIRTDEIDWIEHRITQRIIELFAFARKELRDYYYSYVMSIKYTYMDMKVRLRLNCFHTKRSDVLDKYNESVLFQFLRKNKGYVIAGGFPTQLWWGTTPRKSSDIDIFILDIYGAITKFLKFLVAHHILTVEQVGCVFQFSWYEFDHKIQVICIKNVFTAHDVIDRFDLSHCKCLIYLGKLYAAPDAEHSFRSKTCVTYHVKTKMCRAQKVLQHYCKKILNLDVEHDAAIQCCTKASWQIVEIETAIFTFGRMANYDEDRRNRAHQYASTAPSIKLIDYRDFGAKKPYLEACIRMRYFPTFTLKLTECPKFDPLEYFCSADSQAIEVYRFWQRQYPKIDQITQQYKDTRGHSRSQNMIIGSEHSFRSIVKLLDEKYIYFRYFPSEYDGDRADFRMGEEYTFYIEFRSQYVYVRLMATDNE